MLPPRRSTRLCIDGSRWPVLPVRPDRLPSVRRSEDRALSGSATVFFPAAGTAPVDGWNASGAPELVRDHDLGSPSRPRWSTVPLAVVAAEFLIVAVVRRQHSRRRPGGDAPVAVPGMVTIVLLLVQLCAATVAAWALWPSWLAVAVTALHLLVVITEQPRWRSGCAPPTGGHRAADDVPSTGGMPPGARCCQGGPPSTPSSAGQRRGSSLTAQPPDLHASAGQHLTSSGGMVLPCPSGWPAQDGGGPP